MDALVYASIKNNVGLTDSAADKTKIDNMARTVGLSDMSRTEFKAKADEILSNTTIKRACCMRANKDAEPFKVGVRIPIPTGYNIGDEVNSDIKLKFKYFDKKITVPTSMCGTDKYAGTETCDTFYKVYCANMLESYMKENNGSFDKDEWPKYKLECACHGKLDEYGDPNALSGMPRKCYINSCTEQEPGIYLDLDSRTKQCSSAICTAIVQATDNKVGGNMNVSSQINQKCGPQLEEKRAADQAAYNAKSASEKAAIDKAAADKAVADKALADKAVADKAVADKAVVDKAAADKAAADKAAADKAAADKAAADKASADKASADKTVADKAAADNTVNKPINQNPVEKASIPANNPPSTPVNNSPTAEESSIKTYFTKDKNYAGFIGIAIIILIICLLCSSAAAASK
jgi:hypothetical protein